MGIRRLLAPCDARRLFRRGRRIAQVNEACCAFSECPTMWIFQNCAAGVNDECEFTDLKLLSICNDDTVLDGIRDGLAARTIRTIFYAGECWFPVTVDGPVTSFEDPAITRYTSGTVTGQTERCFESPCTRGGIVDEPCDCVCATGVPDEDGGPGTFCCYGPVDGSGNGNFGFTLEWYGYAKLSYTGGPGTRANVTPPCDTDCEDSSECFINEWEVLVSNCTITGCTMECDSVRSETARTPLCCAGTPGPLAPIIGTDGPVLGYFTAPSDTDVTTSSGELCGVTLSVRTITTYPPSGCYVRGVTTKVIQVTVASCNDGVPPCVLTTESYETRTATIVPVAPDYDANFALCRECKQYKMEEAYGP